jgi:hypothetical protein
VDGALGYPARRSEGRWHEALHVEAGLEILGRPDLPDRVEQGRRAADERLGHGVFGIDLGEVAGQKVPVDLARARSPRVGANHPDVRVGNGDPLELVAIDRQRGIGCVVEECDRAFVALGA